jgi:hypothetical protein
MGGVVGHFCLALFLSSAPLVVARGTSRFGDSKGVLGVALFLGEPRVRFAESLVEVLSLSSHLPKVEEGVLACCMA